MRIAIDCRSVFQGMGGIGRYAASLLRELAQLDKDNDYVAYFTHLELPQDFHPHPRVEMIRFEAGMVDERFDQLILPTQLESDRIDVYHNPTFAVPVVRTRAALISTVHDVVFRRHPELVEPHLRKYLDKSTERACKRADRIVTVSEFSKAELLELYSSGAERVTVIHNGITPPVPRPKTGSASSVVFQRQGLPPEGYVLYVGSIEPKKNIDLLLRALAILRQSGKNCPALALVGSRNEQGNSLESRIQASGLADAVHILGYVSPDELEDLYAHAGVFVYPSLYEGFGFPPLEAMARGVPTIVSDVSSLPEVVGEAALKVSPSDAAGLARLLRELLGNGQMRLELSRKGVERAGLFTWRASAQKHLEVYSEVMDLHERTASRV